jgi:tRNA pseudouridine55 synthase
MDGVLVIDKPPGITSHDVVAKARRVLGEKRIGHTGTLDPFASGVLVLLAGRATRLARFIDKDEKEYEATIRFGWEACRQRNSSRRWRRWIGSLSWRNFGAR